jgi:excisionase family DNA binding protein
MVVTKTNAPILGAAVSLLKAFCPELTPEQLAKALDGVPATETAAKERPAKPYSRKEAAEVLQVSLNTVNRYMNTGLLRRINIGPRHVLIDASSVQALLEGGAHE